MLVILRKIGRVLQAILTFVAELADEVSLLHRWLRSGVLRQLGKLRFMAQASLLLLAAYFAGIFLVSILLSFFLCLKVTGGQLLPSVLITPVVALCCAFLFSAELQYRMNSWMCRRFPESELVQELFRPHRLPWRNDDSPEEASL